MPLSAGDTAILHDGHYDGERRHLYIVLCDPKGDKYELILVNVTSLRDNSDTTTILNPGDHSFIKHESVVNYYNAGILAHSNAEVAFRNGDRVGIERLKPAVLQRVQQGLLDSPYADPKVIKFFEMP